MPRQKRTYTPKTVLFIVVAIILMVLLDRWLFPMPSDTQKEPATQQQAMATRGTPDPVFTAPQKPDFGPPRNVLTDIPKTVLEEAQPEQAQAQAWKRYAVPVTLDPDKPRIAIIIDDMGVDQKHSRMVAELPSPLTLAFLPYGSNIAQQAEKAREKGHELMVHVPMAPTKATLDTGPNVLTPEMDDSALKSALDANLGALSGYVGINNHMGSRMTQDRAAMDRVMVELKKRGYAFIDSRTINTSVAAEAAAAHGVPHAVRDVFIDHEESYEFAKGALADVERIARRKGHAIAIGHPKTNTIEALKVWLPTLEEKGFQLVPVSALVED